jgi:ligand-binding SRPBCC domain-containing protein
MIFERQFEVRSPLARVREFHAQAASLVALTPPLMPMRLDASPSVLHVGDSMSFRMWLGPFPIRWTAHIDQAGPEGFTDRQTAGPFAEWVHRHTFEPISVDTSRVVDSITASRRHVIWARWADDVDRPAGLFAYRRWKTPPAGTRGSTSPSSAPGSAACRGCRPAPPGST